MKTLQAELTALGSPSIHHYLGGPWQMHLPFAYHLVRELNPKIFVELGVYKGESYFAFCQSVRENNLATECFGVDTWRGDLHSGLYCAEIGEEVAAHNSRYASFSQLLAMTFNEAMNQFQDGSIDLLHIDGAHRYEDVRDDFEMWRPKISEKGIVLFHDVMEREHQFGVYRLWEEIARPRASFLFEFGHGLGVWKAAPVANDDPPFLRRLFLASSHKRQVINRHYATMAEEVELSVRTRPDFAEDRIVPTYLQVFGSRSGVPSEESSSTIEILPGRWCRPKIDLPWGLGDGSVPLRLDPVNRTSVVDIAVVSLRLRVTGEILWRADRGSGLEELVVRGTALRLPHSRLLKLFAYADDPQIYFPTFNQDQFQEPLTLEILLRVERSAEAIDRAIAGWNESDISPSLKEVATAALSGAPNSLESEDDQITMVVCSAGESGYSEERSTRVTYARNRWSHLDIALQLGLGSLPLRLDPLTTIGLIDVAALTIRSAINDEVLWRANGGGDLESLQVSGSAVRIPHPHLARVLSYGDDPQIYLPAFPRGKFDGSLRLEMWLKTETGLDSIRKGISELAAMSSQAFATTSQTQGLLEQSNLAISDKELEVQALQGELREAAREREEALALAREASQKEKTTLEEMLGSSTAALDEARTELGLARNKLGLATTETKRQSKQVERLRQDLKARASQIDHLAHELSLLKKQLVVEHAAKIPLMEEFTRAGEKLRSLKQDLALMREREIRKRGGLIRKILGGSSAPQNQKYPDIGPQDEPSPPPYRFWLDSPVGPSPAGEKVFFAGWVLPPLEEKVLGMRALVRGETFIGQYGFERSDVAAAFSDEADAAHPGFSVGIPLSVGLHEVALQALASTGKWTTFYLHQHQVTGDSVPPREDVLDSQVDRPAGGKTAFQGTLETPGHETIVECGLMLITGWLYVETGRVTELIASAGDGTKVTLTHSVLRKDVAEFLRCGPSSAETGFEGYLPVPLNYPGYLKLTIEAVLADGTRMVCFQRNVLIRLPETPSSTPSVVELSDDERYNLWIEINRLTPYLLKRMILDGTRLAKTGPRISILVPTFNPRASHLEALIESVRGQLYPNWQLCVADDASTQPHVRPILERAAADDPRIQVLFRDTNGHIVQASNSALALAQGDYVGLLDHDDLLSPDALLHVAEALIADRSLDVLFTDEDKLSGNTKQYDPIFKGAFSPEMSITHNYIQHFAVIRKSLVRKVGGFRPGFEGAQDLDLYLRILEQTTPGQVQHLPFVCYHWRSHAESTASTGAQKTYVFDSAAKSISEALRRRKLRAAPFLPFIAAKNNCCLYQLRWSNEILKENPVTIIIPTKNRGDLLRKCIASLERTVNPAAVSLIVVDDFSEEAATRHYLDELEATGKLACTVIQPRTHSTEFNFSKLVNDGVARATTPLVLLLNNDTEALEAGWLEDMAGWMSVDGVAAVGAKLLYPDGTIQHAGVIVGSHGGLAEHIFHRLPKDVIGFNFLTHAARNVTAVTGACLLTSKAAFSRVNGFDEENFGMEYNDVDYCLRLGQLGKRVVFTPQAVLLHHCGKSRGFDFRPQEHINFLTRYPGIKDAFYNESLDPDRPVALNPHRFVHVGRIGRLKLLLVSHNLNLEGAPKILFERASWFASVGQYEIVLVSSVDGPLRQQYEAAGIPVRITENPLLGVGEDSSAFIERLQSISVELEAGSFDLIIANTLHCFWAVSMAKLLGLPVIWNVHESTTVRKFFPFSASVIELIEDCLGSADRVAFEAAATRTMFYQHERQENFVTLPGSVDVQAINEFSASHAPESLRRKHGIDSGATVVSLIGTTCARKGQHLFVEVIRKLQFEDGIDPATVCFLMVGARESPYLDFLRDQLDASGVNSTFLIEERDDVYDFFCLSDIFVCASYQESFPRVILEAMAFKLGIVSADIFGVPEMISDGEEGFLVPAGDVSQLARRIQWLIEKPGVRKQLGAKAHSKVTRLFNSAKQLGKHLDLTKEVVARHFPSQAGPARM